MEGEEPVANPITQLLFFSCLDLTRSQISLAISLEASCEFSKLTV